MSPHLEEQVPQIQHQQQNRHRVTHRQQVRPHFCIRDAQTSAVATGSDGEVESGGDEHGNDGDKQEGGVELRRGGFDGLFGESYTAGEEAPECQFVREQQPD